MSYHPKDHPLPTAQRSTELATAEAKYCLMALDLTAAPLGSRDWTLYWAGWHARSKVKSVVLLAETAVIDEHLVQSNGVTGEVVHVHHAASQNANSRQFSA